MSKFEIRSIIDCAGGVGQGVSPSLVLSFERLVINEHLISHTHRPNSWSVKKKSEVSKYTFFFFLFSFWSGGRCRGSKGCGGVLAVEVRYSTRPNQKFVSDFCHRGDWRIYIPGSLIGMGGAPIEEK